VFDLDNFLSDCLAARQEGEPRVAIKEVLARAVSASTAVADALPPERAELVTLHRSPELTVLKVVWAPGMRIDPHEHRMWATIGIYTGGEDNLFYRRDGEGLEESGGRELRVSDVCLLGDDVVHAVANPTSVHTGAIHIYGGDFFATPRSEWTGDPLREQPHDVQRLLARFEAANVESTG
jgi:predicted metal-dependent enzyme (double-stranded beta helix superfamily)